jgi:hypothetical protein
VNGPPASDCAGHASDAGYLAPIDVGRRVFGVLGLNVDAAAREYEVGYRLLLPAARRGGYRRWLRDKSLELHAPLGEEQAIEELATDLRLPRDDARLPAVSRAFRAAEEQTGLHPQRLSREARVCLVRTLARSPRYARLLEDALVEAFRVNSDP